MVGVKRQKNSTYCRTVSTDRSRGAIKFIRTSFSAGKVARQFPLLSGVHRITDGALLGVLLAVLLASAFSLHWRYLWSLAYRNLEVTRDLTNQTSESTASIETYLLTRSGINSSMVPTKADNLLHMDYPIHIKNTVNMKSTIKRLSKKKLAIFFKHGY